MVSSLFRAVFTAAALAQLASAHMVMNSPVPWQPKVLNNSPLDDSGDNFPCKMVSGSYGPVDSDVVNQMTIGEDFPLTFMGGATHGGGSCQVSLSKDLVPTAKSKFMVIKSIEGGCMTDNAGNVGNDASDTTDAKKFTFQVPDHPDLGPGDYTVAWSWVNKIGNREFYMNCGKAHVSAAKKKRYAPSPPKVRRDQSPLPNMFVINLTGITGTCKAVDSQNLKYPNPGSVLELDSSEPAPVAPTGDCGAAAAAATTANTGSTAGSAATSAVASSASNAVVPITTSASSAASQITQTAGGSFFATLGGSGSATVASVTATSASAVAQTSAATTMSAVVTSSSIATSAAHTQSVSAAAPSSSSTGTSSTTGDLSGQSCASVASGMFSCIDGKSWQQCASGTWSQKQASPPGTHCTAGQTMNLQFIADTTAGQKRDLRSHIARRRRNLRGGLLS